MSRQRRQRKSNDHGQVLVRPHGKKNIRLRGTKRTMEVSHWTYRWTPPRDLSCEMPDVLQIAFDVYDYGDGIRRFWPADGFQAFVEYAFAAGLPLLARAKSLDSERRQEIRRLKLLFDRVNGMQDHLGREFRSRSSLYLGRRSRAGESDVTVLPETLGNPNGQGPGWTIDELIQRGRERAIADGIESPSEAIAIQRGLIAAAQMDPLEALAQEALVLVRMALFSVSDGQPVAAEQTVDAVSIRLRDALYEHLDEPLEDFDKWFSGPNNNLLKALARRAGYADGKLDHQDVRSAILDLGWQAYSHIAQCIDAWAQAFLAALPQGLSTRELSVFAQVYQRQPWLGGLVLPLLADRRGLISPVIGGLLTNPTDRSQVGVLHRLLTYYAQMCAVRRRADRMDKSRRNEEGDLVQEIGDIQLENRARQAPNEQLASIIGDYLACNGIRCPHGCETSPSVVVATSTESIAIVDYSCECHRWNGTTTLNVADLRNFAKMD